VQHRQEEVEEEQESNGSHHERFHGASLESLAAAHVPGARCEESHHHANVDQITHRRSVAAGPVVGPRLFVAEDGRERRVRLIKMRPEGVKIS
jgi:hypothetical protein